MDSVRGAGQNKQQVVFLVAGRARHREVGHRRQPRRRAVGARAPDAPRDRLEGVHREPAQDRRQRAPARCSSTSATRRTSTEPLDVVDPRRGAPDPDDQHQPLHAREGAHGQGPDRRHPRRQPRVGLLHRRPAGRAPGRGRQHGPDPRGRRQALARGPRVRARGAVPLERLRFVHPVGRQHPRARPDAAGALAGGRRVRLPDRRPRSASSTR